MRHGHHIALVILAVTFAWTDGAADAADVDIPQRPAPANHPAQQDLANCNQWTDQCVTCSRGAQGEPPVCSNIGIACQPQAMRCLSPAAPQGEPAKK